MTDTTLETARDTLATAASLGLPIAAPAGTTIYVYWFRNPGVEAPAIQTRNAYSTYDGALEALADEAIRLRDSSERVNGSPWGCPDFYANVTHEQWVSDMTGWKRREREAQDSARDIWIAARTPYEIVVQLLGAENPEHRWTIRAITVEP